MAKVITWYVYTEKKLKPKYLGYIKDTTNAALKEAARRWPGKVVDLVNKKFIADKQTRTIKVPPKKEKKT